jgi:lipopolysaccharide export system protein LptC
MTDKKLQQTNRNRIATEQVFARERRRSRNVRRLKVALPVLAVLMTAGLVGKSLLARMGDVSIDIAGTSIKDGRLIMANPRMAGYTGENRPYEMQAERAIQSVSNDDVVDLENIDAKLPVGAKDWATVGAASGKLVKSQSRLTIDSPALVKTTDGMVAQLQSAVIDIDSGELTTDDPVRIDTDGSRVTADSMTVTDGGSLMVFEKRVKVHIEGNRVRTASAAGERDAQE